MESGMEGGMRSRRRSRRDRGGRNRVCEWRASKSICNAEG